MILKEDSTEQKLRGAYYTPLKLAEKMVDFFKKDASIKSILEPSCGDGVFVDALVETQFLTQNRKVTAIEIEKNEAQKVAEKLKNNPNVSVVNRDFFEFYQKYKDINKYDMILGNPPYIRYQYLEEKQRMEMAEILTSHGMKANKLINTWVGFMVACVHMLSDNGKIAFVIPAEILQVAYAEDLRLFLSNKLSKITLLTFEELVFPGIEQEVVVFIGEKGDSEKGIRIIELNNLDDLENLNIYANGFQKLSHVHEKWTKYFTTEQENQLILDLKNDDRFQTLSETGIINVGITTGNNKYFSVDKKMVEVYDLTNVVRPLIGRSSHAHSVFFKYDDWKKNVDQGKAAYLIDFPDVSIEKYSQGQKKYIELGEKNGDNTGYKCKIREKWYQIPSVWVPDAFFLRRNNLYPKFVLNCCNAVSTDTMHRIKFNNDIEPERIVLSYYNSISFAFTEICGRSYGGGVLEILPGEVGNVLVPILDCVPIEKVKEILHRGYIGWSSCDNICMDMHDCLDMCAETLEMRGYMVALEAATYILVSGVKLASHADSSSGMLTDVIMCTYELIEKCAKEVEKQDKQMRDQALALIIKEARKSAFDGWTDWRYDLLKCGICLCDEKSAKKLEKVLDTLLEISREDYYPEYTKKEDLIVRYLLHRHLYGKKNTQKELYQNIAINELRIIAIKDAMEDKNYDEAEKLCLEKANAEETWHYHSSDPEDWNNVLYDIYKTANNTEKQIAQAKKLLLMGNEKFWDVLKQIYKEHGAWNENYESLLDELKNSKRTVCYRTVLISENEKKRLLDDVMENPYDLFYYGKYLVKDYPEQVYELCYKEISERCAQAKDRREYKKITKNIAQLIKWKGNDTAKSLIEELMQRYPRKPALLDELEKVEKKL